MAVIDKTAYAALLAETLPMVIRSDRENERLISEMERIDSLPHPTAAEREFAELIAVLVQEYERRYDLGNATPLDALRHLMEERGLRQRDLLEIFGSSSVASEVINGKRAISKQHARRLAAYFSVPVSLFIAA